MSDTLIIIESADAVIEVENGNPLASLSLTIGDTTTPTTAPRWATELITAAVSVITDDNFKKNISPIIWIDGAPYDWQAMGAVQDTTAGTIDFSACTSINSEVMGTMRYQYWD